MHIARIKDIYAGKPDAKDEVDTMGISPFIDNYVVPENFNKDALVNGTSCFITGYKGTGKTALLYYLDSYIHDMDPQTCSSFIFFKRDYEDLKKQEFAQLSKRLFSALSIGNDVVLDGNDFEYIWRWQLYVKIVEDNQQFNNGLFKLDDLWSDFENKVSQIAYKRKRGFLRIPNKAHIECKWTDPTSGTVLSPAADLDFGTKRVEDSDEYRMFVKIIEEADDLFERLCLANRSDIPYYIFIDELEAYYGDKEVFIRDLSLIRDLIFTVKKINLVMGSNSSVKTKIICSVRSEIINSINRFVVPKELNKVTSGFETPLKWDYKNTNSFQHPILKILTKRIKYADSQCASDRLLLAKWFPEKINNYDPAHYILNNSWCKPRDIVRLILSAQNCMASENESFSQSTIDMCKKKYSQDSLDEIKEEMRALYTPEEIDTIIICLTGFKRIFSFREIESRINYIGSNTFLKDNLMGVLKDLYRLGIIGNYLDGQYRWQHKGDNTVILDDNWLFIIHPALLSALSVNSKQDEIIANKRPKRDEIVTVRINKVYDHCAFCTFIYNRISYEAYLHISNITEKYVHNIHEYIIEGEEHSARLLRYNKAHHNWDIRIIDT